MVENLRIVRWVAGYIPHGDQLGYFSFQPVLYDWCMLSYPWDSAYKIILTANQE